jgi:hypothetical protein
VIFNELIDVLPMNIDVACDSSVNVDGNAVDLPVVLLLIVINGSISSVTTKIERVRQRTMAIRRQTCLTFVTSKIS